jgi:hypothetical protein
VACHLIGAKNGKKSGNQSNIALSAVVVPDLLYRRKVDEKINHLLVSE